jgi:hypothetical protein
MYLLLSSLTVLRSCFHLQVVGEVHTFSQESFELRTIFTSLSFAGLAGLCFWDLGGLSLRLFVCEVAMNAFLFDVAETKLPGHFWKIHLTFLELKVSRGSAC